MEHLLEEGGIATLAAIEQVQHAGDLSAEVATATDGIGPGVGRADQPPVRGQP
jgi:hypothetical protein